MSDTIDELCATCKCNKDNCKRIIEIKKGKCKVLKCLNYELDASKLHPYTDFRYKVKSRCK